MDKLPSPSFLPRIEPIIRKKWGSGLRQLLIKKGQREGMSPNVHFLINRGMDKQKVVCVYIYKYIYIYVFLF